MKQSKVNASGIIAIYLLLLSLNLSNEVDLFGVFLSIVFFIYFILFSGISEE